MKLWLLMRIADACYDEYQGHVIAAFTEESARALATSISHEDDLWTDPARSTCEVIEPGATERIILSDFNAG